MRLQTVKSMANGCDKFMTKTASKQHLERLVCPLQSFIYCWLVLPRPGANRLPCHLDLARGPVISTAEVVRLTLYEDNTHIQDGVRYEIKAD